MKAIKKKFATLIQWNALGFASISHQVASHDIYNRYVNYFHVMIHFWNVHTFDRFLPTYFRQSIYFLILKRQIKALRLDFLVFKSIWPWIVNKKIKVFRNLFFRHDIWKNYYFYVILKSKVLLNWVVKIQLPF